MKIVLISAGVILLIVVLVQIYAMSTRTNIETYPYTVVKSFKDFEIRDYEASLFTSVKMPTAEYEKASNRGFSALAGYIFGGNEEKEKIAMTSPVAMALEDSITMMFMVPKNYRKEDLPRPLRGDIQFREEPAKTVAAIRYGGWTNNQKIEKYKQILTDALNREGISIKGPFYYLGYNPPFDLINRRNEIIVEIDKATISQIQS